MGSRLANDDDGCFGVKRLLSNSPLFWGTQFVAIALADYGIQGGGNKGTTPRGIELGPTPQTSLAGR